jgi:hypothetical protein
MGGWYVLLDFAMRYDCMREYWVMVIGHEG